MDVAWLCVEYFTLFALINTWRLSIIMGTHGHYALLLFVHTFNMADFFFFYFYITFMIQVVYTSHQPPPSPMGFSVLSFLLFCDLYARSKGESVTRGHSKPLAH